MRLIPRSYLLFLLRNIPLEGTRQGAILGLDSESLVHYGRSGNQMSVSLRDWYGPNHVIHRAILLRECGRHFLSPGEPYPKGTEVQAVIDDPERPGMADVQLPNGDMIRMMLSDIEVITEARASRKEGV